MLDPAPCTSHPTSRILPLTPDAHSGCLRFLRQAMMARRVLILLDGLDEGGVARQRIERHVAEVLAPQGLVMLTTSRPAGINEARYTAFTRLSLSPLTEAQQQQAIEQRVGAERAEALVPYLRDVVPIDHTGQRVTGNPLMLSMVKPGNKLADSVPKVLFAPLPVLLVTGQLASEKKNDAYSYSAPCYKSKACARRPAPPRDGRLPH